MPMEFQPTPEQVPQQQQQQQLTQSMTQLDHTSVVALSIAAMGKQLGDLAHFEKEATKRELLLAESAEIVRRAMRVAHRDGLYITVPPAWEPPNMLEPCPTCQHMRSKGQRP